MTLLGLLRQWTLAPGIHYRLFRNFIRQEFFAQFSASAGGFLWLFLTPAAHILIYSFVFSYIFRVRPPAEFGQVDFVLFMITGYLPWFAFAEALGRSPSLLLEKAPLITKVRFPVQVLPAVGAVVPYLTHAAGMGVLLVYLAALGLFSPAWLLLPAVFLLQLLFTLGLVAAISAFCVFLRDLEQIIALLVTVWFFLTPIIYPVSMIGDPAVRELFLLNPMHSFINLYREILLLGELPLANLLIAAPTALFSYLLGGWLFMRIRHAFGDVL